MLKVTILIPCDYNNGKPIPLKIRESALSALQSIVGGYTMDSQVLGKYLMDDGRIAVDYSRKVWVVVDDSDLNALREWASKLARDCQQESIYFEYQPVNMEFIRAY